MFTLAALAALACGYQATRAQLLQITWASVETTHAGIIYCVMGGNDNLALRSIR